MFGRNINLQHMVHTESLTNDCLQRNINTDHLPGVVARMIV